MFALVPLDYVDFLEPKLYPQIARASDQSFGRYTPEDAFDLIKDGTWQLWVAFKDDVFNPDLAFVTTIVQYPRIRALQIVACAGYGLKDHFEEVDITLRRYAKDQGCSIFETYGRHGWSRMIAKYGDVYTSTLVEGYI